MRSNRAFSLLLTSAILSLGLVLAAFPSWTHSKAPSSQPTTQGPKLPKRPPTPLVQQAVYAPISALDDPALAELTLNNNGAQPFAVTPTLYAPDGKMIQCSAVLLGGLQVQTLQIADLIPREEKTATKWGGVQLSYTGVPMQLAAQLVLRSQDLPGNFDVPFTETMDFKSDVQDAVWWTPKTGDATIILGNASEQTMSVDVAFPSGQPTRIQIMGFATEVVHVPDNSSAAPRGDGFVDSVRLTSIAGDMGSLRATGFVRSKATGYMSSIRFYDPASALNPGLFATNLRTEGTVPHLVLRNTTGAPIVATPRFLSPAGESDSPIQLPNIELAPNTSAEVDLTALENQLPSRVDMKAVSVQVLSNAAPGALIGALTSYDPAKRRTYDVPLHETGKLDKSTGSYPIRLEGDYSTVVSVTNTGNGPARFNVVINYSGGQYIPATRTLKAGETAVFDLKQIVNDKVPDGWGHTLPSIKTGQFHWSMVGPSSSPRLIGRAEILSAAKNVSSSFSCGAGCCPDSGPFPFIDPTGFSIAVGDSASFTVTDDWTRGSDGSSYTTPDGGMIWTVGDSSVIDVTDGSVTAKAAGSSGFSGWESNVSYFYDSEGLCDETDNTNNTVQGIATVTPTISQDKPLWFFGLGNTPPSGFPGGITATLTANGASNGTFTWTITNGTSKLQLENGSSTITKTNVNTVGITSTSYSTAANDVTVQLQFTPSGGSQLPAVTWSLSIDSPYKLVLNGTTTTGAQQGVNACVDPTPNPNGTDGYQTLYHYSIKSFFGAQVTFEYANETFAKQADIYIGNTWPAYSVTPGFTSTGNFDENICAVGPSATPPTKPPQGGNVGIDYASQFWFVGSLSEGSGIEVQGDTLTRYQDHGTITNIVSPVR